VLALLTFPLVRRVHFGYVETLQASLKEAEQKLAPTSSVAPRLGASLSQPPQARDKLVERLEQIQPGGLSVLLDPTGPEAQAPIPPSPSSPLDDAQELLDVARELASKDLSRIQSALERLTPRDPGVACALALLGERTLARKVSAALGKIAPRITGQLIDALLDPATSFSIRRRLPRVIQSCVDQRAAEGLLLGLDDERFEVRYECGRALFQLTDADPRIRVSVERTIAAIKEEMSRAGPLLNEEFTEAEDDAPEEPQTRLMHGLRRDRINRVLEHVFQLLCLHSEREPLCIAFRALYVQDDRFRGTALEYLSAVLPEDVRELLWPYLGEERPLPRVRPVQELLSQLAEAEAGPLAPPAWPTNAA
jgi:hypothetical protein